MVLCVIGWYGITYHFTVIMFLVRTSNTLFIKGIETMIVPQIVDQPGHQCKVEWWGLVSEAESVASLQIHAVAPIDKGEMSQTDTLLSLILLCKLGTENSIKI